MHSYLIVGKEEEAEKQVAKLIKKLHAFPLEFPLVKISDARALNSFTSKTFSKKTAIVIRRIDLAFVATLNAFLKNLEEPQKNLYYLLTANSVHRLLPTVVSRCQIIKVKSNHSLDKDEIKKVKKFLEMSATDKLLYVKKIRERKEATKFIEELIIKLHQNLLEDKKAISKNARLLRKTQRVANRLKANTNVSLQLSNLAISLV